MPPSRYRVPRYVTAILRFPLEFGSGRRLDFIAEIATIRAFAKPSRLLAIQSYALSCSRPASSRRREHAPIQFFANHRDPGQSTDAELGGAARPARLLTTPRPASMELARYHSLIVFELPIPAILRRRRSALLCLHAAGPRFATALLQFSRSMSALMAATVAGRAREKSARRGSLRRCRNQRGGIGNILPCQSAGPMRATAAQAMPYVFRPMVERISFR